jgi:SAM-dependent methyltransferase
MSNRWSGARPSFDTPQVWGHSHLTDLCVLLWWQNERRADNLCVGRGCPAERLRRDSSTMTLDRAALDRQRQHWQSVFADNPDMYGPDPSEPGRFAVDVFMREDVREVVELGAGQGRDTTGFLVAGLHVTALDYAPDALRSLQETAETLGAAERLTTLQHDAREPLPLPDASTDAVYSHMLFNMALTTPDLDALAREVHRVLRPGGLHIYTVRHTGDAHYGTGISHGDGMFEHGGFIVHFFDRPLVNQLATGFDVLELVEFEEGDLPRKLWRITLRKQ